MEIPELELTDGAYKCLGFPQASAPDISNLKISGIDVGCIDVATVFDGESTNKVANPRHFNRIKRNLRRKQQQLSKKQKGSNKRAKAKKKVASVYEHLTNTRADFYHKLSRKLVDENVTAHCNRGVLLTSIGGKSVL